MLAVLTSALAKRSALSMSVVFLVAGFLIGDGGLGLVKVRGENLVRPFTELALCTILFVDGLPLPLKELQNACRLPGRALLLGMPLTLLAPAVLAHVILGTSWPESFLVGAS